MPSTKRRSAAANQSSTLSDHARGNSGSCSGQSSVVGGAIRSAGSGICSASALATAAEPEPVPVDRPDERARTAVGVGEAVELRGLRGVVGPGPVRPEVLEVGADAVAVAVEEPLGQVEAVEGLVPELALRVGAEDAGADAGHGRRDDHPAHEVGPGARDALGRARADVVAADDHRPARGRLDQGDHARGLAVDAVLRRRPRRPGRSCRRSRAGRARSPGARRAGARPRGSRGDRPASRAGARRRRRRRDGRHR